MRRLLVAATVLGSVLGSACAAKIVPAPVVTTATFAGTPAANSQQRGWALLQSGDLRNAEREFASALKGTPAFYPAETSLGYVELARKDGKAALAHFDRALELNQAGDGALFVGRGEAL